MNCMQRAMDVYIQVQGMGLQFTRIPIRENGNISTFNWDQVMDFFRIDTRG